jgi:putative transposase
LFRSAGQRNSNNSHLQFWQQDNRPIELSTKAMIDQRVNYIHEHPVKAGIVWSAEDYKYSSAIDYTGGKGLIDIEFV